jgi:hypothetical protein
VAQTAPARDTARSEADRAQGRVDSNTVDADIIAGLAERLASTRERLAEMESRLLVYQGTYAAIEGAEAATLKTAARYLEEHMGPAVSEITNGRYDDIEVDERSLTLRVRAPETGELVDVAELSQGTADQLYLAARLGLVRLVTLDRRPPLILDDPFVTFDGVRAERAVRLVWRFAHEHAFQVLYLTCSDRFDKLADAVVVLPAPSGERVLAQPRAAQRPTEPAAARAATRPGAATRPAQPERPAAAKPAQPAAPAATAAPAAAEESQQTLRFGPDPRRNPEVDAPRRVPAEEPASVSPFAREQAEAAERMRRLAELRKGREAAAAEEEAAADPLSALREAAMDADGDADSGPTDPFGMGRSAKGEAGR